MIMAENCSGSSKPVDDTISEASSKPMGDEKCSIILFMWGWGVQCEIFLFG